MFIVHSFEYAATFLDMLSNTVWTKKTHTHILLTSKLCLQNLANHGCTISSPRSMQRTSRNEDPHRLDFAHFTSLETYQHIPSYTNYVNHTASLVTDKTPPFLPEVLVDLLASGADFRPPLHPQPEVGGKFLGLGSQQRFRKLKLFWRRTMRVGTSTTLILIRHVHSP